ncbi:hypothetical protein K2Z83_24295 [Oscillochloris sp. ZM17-4]|uniref:hypothetical protein n=1 Tax=Oscillochloris sp. ZM17-4 TaxID=2866714 RepID=UPI001C73037E|nr:hypothetical protein [Oscillochloris sp. ZM17-4]MBX0330782.1 hypothetical protein [Oscillochloris sp. ZM17-4]
MAQQRRFSPRDEVYLASTSFEVYMVTGLVFLFIFTAFFITSIKIHAEWMIWPGGVVGAAVGFGVFKLLERREQVRKLAEVTANPIAEEDAIVQ